MTEQMERATADLTATWASLDELLSGLSADDWGVASLCPEWTVHGVVVHLASVEAALAGWRPASADDHFFGRVAEPAERLAALDGPALHAEMRSIMGGRLAEMASMSDAEAELPMMSPVGPATYARFMEVRVFDHWVHELDIRVPLERRADDEGGPAAETALDEIESAMGYIVGKKVGLTEGGLVVHLTGPVVRDLAVAIVDGRARRVDAVADPVTEVTTDSTTFTLLACGRIDPDEPVADGRIAWTGDAEWGERVARNLRFTM